jgi:hypothetical protein
MELVRVESIPSTVYNHTKQNLRELLEGFVNSDMRYAKVVFENEYDCVEYVRSALMAACKRHGYDIKVMYRSGTIYLAKRGA